MEQKDDLYDQYLEKLMKRPRISGYKHYLLLIDKLKKLGIWSMIIETRSNKILKKISQIFKIDYRTIKNWKIMLQGDRNWIPDIFIIRLKNISDYSSRRFHVKRCPEKDPLN